MSNTHVKSVRGRFSAAAETYDVLAVPQSKAAEHLIQLIPPNADGSRILEVGCGTGLLTGHLLKRFPQAHLDAMDLSALMIAQARARFAGNPRIRWFATDLPTFTPLHPYPLIVSNSALHWLPILPDAVRQLSGLVKSGGHLIFSIMLSGTLGELHDARTRVAPHKPPLRRMPLAEEVTDAVTSSGLCILHSDIADYKDSYRGASAFLKSIHDQGVTGGEFSRSIIPLTRGELNKLIEEYDHAYAAQPGQVFATYRVMFVIAVKTPGG